MKKNLTQFSQTQHSNSNYIDRTVVINGIDFEEQFISKLLADQIKNPNKTQKPTITTAFKICKKELEVPYSNHCELLMDIMKMVVGLN